MVDELGEELLEREDVAVPAAELREERAFRIDERWDQTRATTRSPQERQAAHRARVQAQRRGGGQPPGLVSTTSP
jgi:hypothetical protein